ncbi:MAG TPA: precorrin-8X methylmutase [Candidatus Nitrosotalea sp.]|nr:precorrin-8X methylmutase [Candidatus Nitrosotalea sp.]
MNWPTPGGWLERLGQSPDAIEGRSRGIAQDLVASRWSGLEAELAAAMVYAGGDPGLLESISIQGPIPVLDHRVLTDVDMVRSGLRGPIDPGVATKAPGAAELAQAAGTSRAAAGMHLLWQEYGQGGLVVIGNAPTALLCVLDLAPSAPPAFVIATCPGFTLAAVAKRALQDSGLPHIALQGTRGGSGLAVAAANVLLGGQNGT